MEEKRAARCPTYGNHIACSMNCGPVSVLCMECYNNGLKTAGFIITKYKENILDSITITEIFGGHRQIALRSEDAEGSRIQQPPCFYHLCNAEEQQASGNH
jgi:hypothetical protein